MAWSDAQKEIVKKMWLEDGASCSEIARYIGQGHSRNAVIGLIHRNNWLRPGSAGRRPQVTKVPGNPQPTAQVVRLVPKAKQLEALRVAAGELQPIGPVNDFPGSQGCKFIHGDPVNGHWQCCGHKVERDRSYCEVHMPIVYDKFRTEESNARWRLRKDSQRPDGRQFNGKHNMPTGWNEDAA